jgi:predicted small secreted protein
MEETHLKILVLLAWMLSTLALSACNTTRGVGRDIEATGDAIEDRADEAMDEDEDDDDY